MDIPLLTSGEAKVYKTLIELKESSTGDIIKLSGVSHSKIYDILKRLSLKGLAGSINKNGRQYFIPSSPNSLLNIIQEQKRKISQDETSIKKIIANLEEISGTGRPRSILSSFEGSRGMRSVLDLILQKVVKNEEILILGTPKQIGEYSGGYLKEWQKKRIANKSPCRIITDFDSVQWEDDWWKKSKKKKLTFTKKSKTISPTYLVITKKAVLTIYFSNKIICVLIEHPEIAERYKEFFYQIWNSSD